MGIESSESEMVVLVVGIGRPPFFLSMRKREGHIRTAAALERGGCGGCFRRSGVFRRGGDGESLRFEAAGDGRLTESGCKKSEVGMKRED